MSISFFENEITPWTTKVPKVDLATIQRNSKTMKNHFQDLYSRANNSLAKLPEDYGAQEDLDFLEAEQSLSAKADPEDEIFSMSDEELSQKERERLKREKNANTKGD